MSARTAAVRFEEFANDAFPAFRRDAITGEERIRMVRDGDRQGANPAMMLQRDLAEAVALGAFDPRLEPHGRKWSARKTLAFIFVTCGAFWALVAYGIMQLF